MNFFNQNTTRMVSVCLMDFFAKFSIEKYQTISTSGDLTFAQRKIIPVPIQWATREKFVEIMRSSSARKSMNPSLNDKISPVEMQWILPRISCNLTGINFDASRRMIKTQEIVRGTSGRVYTPAPYNLQFEISTISRNLDENLQLMEQIIPYFSPTMNFNLKLYSDIDAESIPFVLDSVSMDNPIDIPEFEERLFTNVYTITAKCNYYIPNKPTKIITHIQTNINSNNDIIQIDTTWIESMNAIQDKFTQYTANSSMANPLFAMKTVSGLTSTYSPIMWTPEQKYLFLTSAVSAVGTSPLVAIQNGSTSVSLVSPALSAVTPDNIVYQNAFKIFYRLDNAPTIYEYDGTPIPITFSKIYFWHIFSTKTDAMQFLTYEYVVI